MKSATQFFVKSCLTYQQAKPNRSKYPCLLAPLHVPSNAWQVITMYFIEGLPRSGAANNILVVIDKFSKYNPFTTDVVAQAFINNIYKLHGLPEAIVSDRDRVFTIQFWKELFKLANVTLQMSSAYHPQLDDQSERVNQCLETFIRCFVHACPKQWSKWLALAEFWYNTSYHSALGHSPFEVLYGHIPRYVGLEEQDTCQVKELDTWLQGRELVSTMIRQHLLRAQARMKQQADKERAEISFEMGDQILLKLQSYVHSSLARRVHQKLAFKYFGPYRIVDRIGAVAYRLALPPSNAIHLVFHVSQLKKFISDNTQVSTQLPNETQVLEAILDTR
jgi:hypothetical protein